MRLPDVTGVTYLGAFLVHLTFSDHLEGDVDLEPFFRGRSGLLAELASPEAISAVYLDEEAGTIAWPNGVDLDPLVLWSEATGRPIPLPATTDA